MIRRATEADIPQLLEMGAQFAAYAPYQVGYSPEATEATLRGLMQVGVVLVSEAGDSLAGVLLGMIAPIWYSADAKAAVELAWWVSPEHRGGRSALQLLRAFEDWAREQGARYISMSDLHIGDDYPAGPLFERMGYCVSERSHVKEV